MSQIALPELHNSSNFQPDELVNLQHYALLTNHQKTILKIMSDAILSDLILTDSEIADRAGIDRNTVRYARRDANFLACLREITLADAANNAPEVLQAMKKSAIKGSVRAQETYLRVTGVYTPKTQLESKSQNLNISAKINAGDAIGEFVALLCDKGWNKERIINEIDQVYDQLKEQGRIV